MPTERRDFAAELSDLLGGSAAPIRRSPDHVALKHSDRN